MLRAGLVGGVVAAGLLVGGGGALAAGPPASLLQAVQRTISARSESVSLTERISLGKTTVVVALRGTEQPRAHLGSFVYSMSPAQTGLAQATEIMDGSKIYVHYDVFDALHAKNPAVKPWLLVDSKSNLGIDPTGLAAFGVANMKGMTDVKTLGGAIEGGTHVTRYQGTLDLRKAAASPQMQALLSHLPSASAAVLNGKELVEISVGADGYMHRIRATMTSSLAGTTMRVAIDSVFTNFNTRTAAPAAPPASEVMSLSRLNQLLGLASQSTQRLLDRVLLQAPQVGAGYRLAQIPGGRLVQGEPTLDYCGFSYPSEALRTARIQVVYTKKGSRFEASNEVVSYQPGGAQQALREARHAATACPQGTVKNRAAGVTALTHQARLVTDPHLLPGAVALLDHEIATVKGKRETSYSMLVYQVRGNVLSGVYGNGPTAAATEKATLHAAEQSARNLERSAPAATS